MRGALVITGLLALIAGSWVYLDERPLVWVAGVWRSTSTDAVVTPPPPISVTVEAARKELAPIYLSTIGTVQAFNTVSVKTQVDGQITEILFQEGQDVKAGDRLAIIDPRPYQARLDQQIAARMRDQALLKGAELDLARYEELVKKSFATQQQVDQQQAQVGQYQGSVLNDEAQIDYARTQLGFTTIASPIDGRVGIRQVDIGNFVRAADGASIVVIAQLRPISVIFTASADAVARSKLSLGAMHVPVIALGQDGVTELDRGFVEMADNQVDQTTGTIKLKAAFPNEVLKLWPGNFVNGRLIVETRRDGVTVSSAAVRHGPRCDFAWIVRADETAATRCVTAGQAFAGRTLIEKGLAVGDRVVVDGQYRLEEGSKVEARPPAPTKPTG
ncbi:efflux RND transporter periplasmic adaptor subunit [Methylocapsa sp. S129]|uniref:efflux RND transporter periplasmic adaptor subunit n=1 Tax=Methylocapsa sp. S129 TaxID=1641869 RepID=UPI00131C075B|nr:efflux RND transporter periplasmic adaptor subunit [Methylocapsa sp. S129]